MAQIMRTCTHPIDRVEDNVMGVRKLKTICRAHSLSVSMKTGLQIHLSALMNSDLKVI